jgi:PhnB protein
MSEQSVTPYMILKNAATAIDFYKEAFGAAELMRHADPDGRVRHAEIQIGNSTLMLVDEFPHMRSVQSMGGSPVQIFLRVDDADTCAKRAVAAGAKITKPVADESYGRSGGLTDPFGLVWWICSESRKA